MPPDTTKIETVAVEVPPSPAGMDPMAKMPMDPFSFLLFGPMIMFMNAMNMFQQSMMAGYPGMGNRQQSGGLKIVELKRDQSGNIISILEKW